MEQLRASKMRVDPARSNIGETLDCCRICGGDVFCVIDLGCHPFANALLLKPCSQVKVYPLMLFVCTQCATAQLSYCADHAELYEDYTYITPQSQALSAHYARLIEYSVRHGYMNTQTNLLEVGSNIGRFLECARPFVNSIIGVDPAVNISKMAIAKGIPTLNDFFNIQSAGRILEEQGKKQFILARHCFAHNEKPWLMLEGVKELLSDDGVFLIENAYFPDTIAKYEFDQIYHEHMYYHSLRSISAIISRYDLMLVDVFHSTIHGGTMVYVVMHSTAQATPSERVAYYLQQEEELHRPAFYTDFTAQINRNRQQLLSLLSDLASTGKSIHAYGASAKSTTLLNYYGITSETVPYVVDSTVNKHAKYIPLANVQVISEEEAQNMTPDYYLLTVWNYKDEIVKKVRESGNNSTRFILPHPMVELFE